MTQQDACNAACSVPRNPRLQEVHLLAFLGHLILGLLIAGVSGLLFSWLWDRFAPRA